LKLPSSRRHRKGRIEIIPMIDVMFFLLTTFMLASLAMQNLHTLGVNLPKGTAEKMPPKGPVTLTITKDNRIFIEETPVTFTNLATVLTPLLHERTADNQSVVVASDSAASNGITVLAMLHARSAGAQRFLIGVKHVQ
jgi:biopolymer transport protein ExbD